MSRRVVVSQSTSHAHLKTSEDGHSRVASVRGEKDLGGLSPPARLKRYGDGPLQKCIQTRVYTAINRVGELAHMVAGSFSDAAALLSRPTVLFHFSQLTHALGFGSIGWCQKSRVIMTPKASHQTMQVPPAVYETARFVVPLGEASLFTPSS